MDTVLLLPNTWDICLDSSGNIAKASNPYSITQDIASAIKLFLGELYYDTSKGLPYFEQILGQSNPEAIMKAQVEKAANTVPEVVQATCTALFINNKKLSGVLEAVDTAGIVHDVNF